MNPKSFPWTDELDEILADEFLSRSRAELAAMIGCNRKQVVYRLTRLGLTSKKRRCKDARVRRTDLIRQDVIDCYGKGQTSREIGERFGISRNAVLGIWFRARQKKRRRPPTVIREVVSTDAGKSLLNESKRYAVTLPGLRFMEGAE